MLDVCQVRQTPLMSNYVQKDRTIHLIEMPSNNGDLYVTSSLFSRPCLHLGELPHLKRHRLYYYRLCLPVDLI